MMTQPCLFCGRDPSAPDHLACCDGRQGHIEHAINTQLPPFASGTTPDAYATSLQAAEQIEPLRGTQRAVVYDAIRIAGIDGRTDAELQLELRMEAHSQGPRRVELHKLGLIRIKRDADGHAIKRRTPSGRLAIVWIAA